MKKYFILIVLLSETFCYSQSGWSFLQLDPSHDLEDVEFVNAETGFLVEVWHQTPPGSRILKTTNGGLNWFINFDQPPFGVVDIFFLNSSTGFAAGGRLHKTTNAGINWSLVDGSFLPGSLSEIFFINELTGWSANYLTSMSAIYNTTNGGVNWVQQHSSQGYGMRSVFFTTPLTGYATEYGIGNASVFKTTNGSQWTQSAQNIKGESVFFVDQSTGFIAGANFDNRSVLIKTTNSGVDWSVSLLGELFGNYFSVHFPTGTTGYVCGGSGIYKTTNTGINWVQQSIPSQYTLRSIHFINDNTGFCCGNFGTFLKTTTGGISSVISLSSEIPNRFSLSQNFPNPFNPSTKINFAIPNGSSVAQTFLSVYDILGNELAILVNQQLSPGTYSVEWDAPNYPGGIYFYRLSSGVFSETKKMILIK